MSSEAKPDTPAPARPLATAPGAPTETEPPAAERTAPKTAGNSFDQWLATQPPEHYTLQLLGVRERKAADRFLAASGLDPAVTGVVETRYRGGPWYVVVHGSYPDRASARDAIAQLPPRVRRNRPWPRTFGSLQVR